MKDNDINIDFFEVHILFKPPSPCPQFERMRGHYLPLDASIVDVPSSPYTERHLVITGMFNGHPQSIAVLRDSAQSSKEKLPASKRPPKDADRDALSTSFIMN